MDIDCDGNSNEPADATDANDGRCGNSADTQGDTAFEDTLRGYDQAGLTNLNAYVHPYVVFGNAADDGAHRAGYTTFDPTKYGIEPLSLMAVVCNQQVVSSPPPFPPLPPKGQQQHHHPHVQHVDLPTYLPRVPSYPNNKQGEKKGGEF